MARERIATRKAVFEAAETLVAMGQKPTVAAVRDRIGGGSNTTIQDLLTDWRRAYRNNSGGRAIAPTGPIDGGTVRRAGAIPAVLPNEIEDLVHRFAYHLSRTWSDALTEASPDDTLAVIRAAAEARVREAEDRARDLENAVADLESELSVARAERDGLATALDTAAEQVHEAQTVEARLVADMREIQERSIARIESLQAERDTFARTLAHMGRRPQLREATGGAAREVWPGTQSRAAGDDPAVIPFPDTAKRNRDLEGADPVELERLSADVDKLRRDRDDARTEIARLSGENKAFKKELEGERRKMVATLSKERDRHSSEVEGLRGELDELKVRAAKQSAWIREARVRMEKVGLLKRRTDVR